MSEIVDLVAKAIAEADGDYTVMDHHRQRAVAAIEAVRVEMNERLDKIAAALLQIAREKGERQGYDMTPVNDVDVEFFRAQAQAAIEEGLK